MRFRRTERSLLPVHRNMPKKDGESGRFDLLLTPQFYLMKREKLAVHYAYQARKVARALMEETGAHASWTFEVFPDGEAWIFVAYDPREVVDVLKKAGISPDEIGRLYFAQQFAEQLKSPLLLDGRETLVTVDGIVTLLPVQFLPEEMKNGRAPEELRRPARSFTFRADEGREWMGPRETFLIGLLFAVLGAVWTVEGVRYRKEKREFEKRLRDVSEGNPAFASTVTRQNIYHKYSVLDRRQREIRQTMRKLGSLVSRDSKLSFLAFDLRGYKAIIEARAPKLKRLVRLAESVELPAKVEEGHLLIEGKWK